MNVTSEQSVAELTSRYHHQR